MAIARAVINDPKIVLADEPAGNLDTQNSEIVLSMLRRLNKELGQTIVMITHNPEAAAYSDRLVYMRDGVIVDEVRANQYANVLRAIMSVAACEHSQRAIHARCPGRWSASDSAASLPATKNASDLMTSSFHPRRLTMPLEFSIMPGCPHIQTMLSSASASRRRCICRPNHPRGQFRPSKSCLRLGGSQWERK